MEGLIGTYGMEMEIRITEDVALADEYVQLAGS